MGIAPVESFLADIGGFMRKSNDREPNEHLAKTQGLLIISCTAFAKRFTSVSPQNFRLVPLLVYIGCTKKKQHTE